VKRAFRNNSQLTEGQKLVKEQRTTMPKPFKVILLIFLASQARAGLIVNGDFESGDFTGWIQSGWFIDTTNPNSGVYDASTGCGSASCTTIGNPNSAYFYQDVATTPGATYNLSFFYNSGQTPTSASELLVLWGDPTAPTLSTVVDLVNVDTSGAFVQYIGTVTATGATSRLEFLGRQDLDFFYLDDASLVAPASTVPEPPSSRLVLIAILWMLIRPLR
jgi:hypothetical protein